MCNPISGAVSVDAGDFQQVAHFGLAWQRHPETGRCVAGVAVVGAQARVVVRHSGVRRQLERQHRTGVAVQGKVERVRRNAGVARHIAGDNTQVVDAVCQVHQVIDEAAVGADDRRADGRGRVEAAKRHGGLARVLHAVVVQIVENVQAAAGLTGAAQGDVVVLIGDPGVACDVAHVVIGHGQGGQCWRAGVDGEDQVHRCPMDRAFVASGVHGSGANAVLAIGQCGCGTGAEGETAIACESTAQQARCAEGVAPCRVVFCIQVHHHGICRQGACDADGPVFAGDVVGVDGAPVIASRHVQRGHGGGQCGIDGEQVDRRHADRRRAGARRRVPVKIGRVPDGQTGGVGQDEAVVQIRLRQRDGGLKVGADGIVGVVNFNFSTHCSVAAQ